ncbi:hypothetical protein CA233_09540 [Sphingomonas sp. ABOLD]|uniref:PASTA domain-containing protein n=1 Tax=Sphingomonas trueperi TaxID=53317 RepID=A0A7X5Y1G5_9SPHN|nr:MULTISPECIES: PASTA domain-containing protein [Sphingomonas]NJB99339.1 hypothetical protein [Sphingomonas trueperi]RSV40652.1 hypothetical protein CA234_11120 [Sphingomonas sp. ABOLE]RSV48542.1 hypothetical protein CA233_09540 [Sphingomonas sp. ABOLD]
MNDTLREVFSDGFAAPLGEVIAAVGRGVADAQAALDRASLEATLEVYHDEGTAAATLLRDIGYRPTFYVLPETTCEVQVSMRVGGSNGVDGAANAAPGSPASMRSRPYVTPVDAGFANRFGYQASASAKLTFKIVPVPPPSALDDNRPVPDLIGRTGGDADAALASLGLFAAFRAAGDKPVAREEALKMNVRAQDSPPLALIAIGGTVTLTVA